MAKQSNIMANAPVVDRQTNKSGGVNFALDTTMFIESSYPIMNEDQLLEVFYSPEQFQAFRDEIKAVTGNRRIRHSKGGLRQGTLLQDDDDNEFCIRGLESRSPQGARRTKSMRMRARRAVLQEQRRQKEANEYDTELLAEIYKGFCIISSSHAQRLAQMDASYSRKQRRMSSATSSVVVDQLPTSCPFKNNKEDDCDTVSTCGSSANYSMSSADTISISSTRTEISVRATLTRRA